MTTPVKPAIEVGQLWINAHGRDDFGGKDGLVISVLDAPPRIAVSDWVMGEVLLGQAAALVAGRTPNATITLEQPYGLVFRLVDDEGVRYVYRQDDPQPDEWIERQCSTWTAVD